MLVLGFPFFWLNLFSRVLVASASFQGSAASPLVGCKPAGFGALANTATLFSPLRQGCAHKGGVNSSVTGRGTQGRRGSVQECTVKLAGLFRCRPAYETNKDSSQRLCRALLSKISCSTAFWNLWASGTAGGVAENKNKSNSLCFMDGEEKLLNA